MSWKSYLKKIIEGKMVRKEPVYIPKLEGSLLEGRSALVTGASSGIGRSIAEAFLANGADVVITGRNADRLKLVAEQLTSSKRTCRYLVLDNARPKLFGEKLADAVSLLPSGELHILVNNAGVLKGGSFGRTEPDDFDAVLETNLRGTYFLSQEVAAYMKREGIEGNILNIASSSSLRPAVSAYTLSKWGVRGLTMGMAKSLVPYGIVVNGLAPGPTATPMLMGGDCSNLDNERVPAGRYAAPEEIANMAVVLASDLGRMVVGDIVYMTGGSGVVTYDDMDYRF